MLGEGKIIQSMQAAGPSKYVGGAQRGHRVQATSRLIHVAPRDVTANNILSLFGILAPRMTNRPIVEIQIIF